MFPEITGGTSSGGRTSTGASGGRVNEGGATGGTSITRAGSGGTSGLEGGEAGAIHASGGAEEGGSEAGGRGGGLNPSGGTDSASGGEAGDSAKGGSGGEPPVQWGPCEAPHAIDDLEDQNESICPNEGRTGKWFTTNDGTTGGKQSPTPDSVTRPVAILDREGSAYAMHTSGSGFTEWGATMGFNLRSSGDKPYDASHFVAITFYAKGRAPKHVRVALRTQTLAIAEQGGTCDTSTTICFKYHGAEISLSETWTRYRIAFDSLKRADNVEGAFEPGKIVGVEFRLMPDADDWDLWLDDVAFEER